MLVAVRVSGDVIVDLLHAVGPEEPEILAQGLFTLLAALGQGGADESVFFAGGWFCPYCPLLPLIAASVLLGMLPISFL